MKNSLQKLTGMRQKLYARYNEQRDHQSQLCHSRKDSETLQGRGPCHRWHRPKTDGMKKDLEEDDDQERNGPGDTAASGLCIEEEG